MAEWDYPLLDALVCIADIAVADVLVHVMGHYNGRNLGSELLHELVSLCFWFSRPSTPLVQGLNRGLWDKARLDAQHQWAYVMRRLCVWVRPLAAATYWELVESVPSCAAAYSHALQSVDWSPRTVDSEKNACEWLHAHLKLSERLSGEDRLVHARAMVLNLEQLRLPMRDPAVSHHAMAVVQSWYSHAMHAVDSLRNSDATDDEGVLAAVFGARDQLCSEANWREQIILLELATTCVVQSEPVFFLTQAPLLIEALRTFLWSPSAVEPALQCMLRLLRGCYYLPHPHWEATHGALRTSGDDPKTPPDEPLRKYDTVMHRHADVRATIVLVAQVHDVLFPGWGSFVGGTLLEKVEHYVSPQTLLRAVGLKRLRELPYAPLLVEPLAEITVAIACHAVQWAVEHIIVPFLKFRRGADSSAAYALVACRGLTIILDPSLQFRPRNAHATDKSVPMLLAPAIEALVRTAYAQVGCTPRTAYYGLLTAYYSPLIPHPSLSTHHSPLTTHTRHRHGHRLPRLHPALPLARSSRRSQQCSAIQIRCLLV